MLLLRLFFLVLSCSSSLFVNGDEEKSNTLSILMPDAIAHQVNDYLCTSVKLDNDKSTYITAFSPSARSKDAHHVLLYGCSTPGSDKPIWNCGEMASSGGNLSTSYEKGPTCRSGSTIIYAWALDADKTELPKDVAFQVGGSTSINYLVLQVHYANIEKFIAGQTDRSGLVLTTSATPTPKRAGVLLLISSGRIRAHSEEVFQVACQINEELVLHPFAFRTHTHQLGWVVSGYRVRGEGEKQEWTELGRRSPQLPQMFNTIEKTINIERGDYVAAMCSMINERSHTVSVGPTNDDEMCNFYVMYWVEGDRLLRNEICGSSGPPTYYFRREPGLNIDKMPDDALRLPHSSSPPASHPH